MLNNLSTFPKRRSERIEDDLIVKKFKIYPSEGQIKSNVSDVQQTETETGTKKIDLISLIAYDEKKNITAGDIIWSRVSKSPFWPSIIWPTKNGKIIDESKITSLLLAGVSKLYS